MAKYNPIEMSPERRAQVIADWDRQWAEDELLEFADDLEVFGLPQFEQVSVVGWPLRAAAALCFTALLVALVVLA